MCAATDDATILQLVLSEFLAAAGLWYFQIIIGGFATRAFRKLEESHLLRLITYSFLRI